MKNVGYVNVFTNPVDETTSLRNKEGLAFYVYHILGRKSKRAESKTTQSQSRKSIPGAGIQCLALYAIVPGTSPHRNGVMFRAASSSLPLIYMLLQIERSLLATGKCFEESLEHDTY